MSAASAAVETENWRRWTRCADVAAGAAPTGDGRLAVLAGEMGKGIRNGGLGCCARPDVHGDGTRPRGVRYKRAESSVDRCRQATRHACHQGRERAER